MNSGDERYMRQAIELAEQARGWTNPNPVVGAIIVKEGAIIVTGYHQKYGELHAERNAIREAAQQGEDIRGATIYVTLEPCCHYGKTPPCTEAIIEAGISRVVVGAKDPNSLVAGKGIQQLREHGIEVVEGVLQAECEEQNRIFLHYIRNRTPYIVMKYAMTLDGKIATAGGQSKWITGEASREKVHRMRHELSGIMVGIGTVLADDPALDCRLMDTKNPIRIICDTALRTPLESKVVRTAREQKTILATACSDRERIATYEKYGCEVINVSKEKEHICLQELMKILGHRGIDSILLEGGGALNWSALQAGLVNEVHAYLAPKIVGGATAKSPVTGEGVNALDEAYELCGKRIELIGEDLLLIGKIKKEK